VFRPAGSSGGAGTAGAGTDAGSGVAGSTLSGQTGRTGEADESSREAIHYIGQLFGVFLLAEYRGGFYIVDQHAGHERVLFDRLRAGARKQTLLVPEEFEVDDDQQAVLQQNARGLREIGVELERRESGHWSLTAVPEACRNSLASVINTATSHPLPNEELERSFYAQIACKAAIKDGDSVDEVTARSLLEEVFALDNARCPHGRPIWYELTKERLFELVGRT
jgi:DNA mismatch repair protein MutL